MPSMKNQGEALSTAAKSASEKIEAIAVKAVADMQAIMTDFAEVPADVQLPAILNGQAMINQLQMRLQEADRQRQMAAPVMPPVPMMPNK